jgi:integrase
MGSGLYCETGGALHPAPRRYFIDGRAFKKKSDPSITIGKLYRDADGKILDTYHRSADFLGTINADWNHDEDAFDPTKYSRAGTKAYAVRECAKAWQLHLESSKKKSRGYVIHTELHFRLHINPCPIGDKLFGDLNVRAITPSQIESLQKHLKEKVCANGRPLAENSVKQVMISLMTLFNRLKERGLEIDGYNVMLDKAPVFPEDWSKTERTKKWWIDEDTQAVLLDRMPEKIRLWMRVFFATGMRPDEVCALHRSDILPDRTIYVQRAIDFYTREEKGTKTGDRRSIDIPESLYLEIASLPVVGEKYLFLIPQGVNKGLPHTSGEVSKMFRPVADDAGLPQLKLYPAGRHSMATKKRNERTEEGYRSAANQLGHASTAMTRRNYVQDDSTRIHVPEIKEMGR